MITENLMALGGWSLKLKVDAPAAIRALVRDAHLDHVVVTGTRIPTTLNRAGVLAAARFTGRIDEIDPGDPGDSTAAKFGGPGLAVWLGDGDSKGSLQHGAVTVASNITTWLSTYFAADSNGLALGSTSGLSGNTLAYDWETGATLRKAIDDLRKLTTVETEWRVTPDGTVDFGAAGSNALFRQTPEVVISKSPEDLIGEPPVLHATKLGYSVDAGRYAEEVMVVGEASAGGTATWVTAPKDWTGSARAHIEVEETTSSTDSANCAALAQTLLGVEFASRWSFQVSIDTYDPRRFLEAGDYLWLWNPDNGLSDVSNPVTVSGAVAFPREARLMGLSWPVADGMGVYLLRTSDGSNDVTDLSEFVEPETGATTLQVGDLAPRLGVRLR